MSESIIVALITGGISLVGTVLTVLVTSSKTTQEMRTTQAVMQRDIEELTREVRLHNSYVTRVPVLEEKVERLEKEHGRATV